MLQTFVFVPIHIVVGVTIYSTGFFVQSILADIYDHRMISSGIIRKLFQHRICNLRDSFEYTFFDELSRFEVLLNISHLGVIFTFHF